MIFSLFTRHRPLAFVVCVSTALGAVADGFAVEVAGWSERAHIMPADIVVRAKLDTGADSSSLHAQRLERFNREDTAWVAFEVIAEDGRRVRLERPLVRTVRVRSALGVGQSRPVVRLGICVGAVYRVTDVTLADRSQLNLPLLIGRRFLNGHLLVDSGKRDLHEPICTEMASP